VQSPILLPLAAVSLFAIGYAHWELHRFVRGRTLLLRVFLLGLGTAMGVVIFGLPGAQTARWIS